MSSRRTDLQEDVRFQLLRRLEANPGITQRELAEEVGVSLGAVNYCLKAFVERGLVKVQNFRCNSNKFAYAYLLTPKGALEKATLTGRFLKRKMQEYDALTAEIEAIRQEQIVSRKTDANSTLE